jgi:hypothetical protein
VVRSRPISTAVHRHERRRGFIQRFQTAHPFRGTQCCRADFFYGINFEFSYNTPHWDPHRYTGEIRPIIGWHLGSLDFIVNPIIDNSYEGVGKLDFAPETRLAWNASKAWAIAAEECDDFGPLQHFYRHDVQSHQFFSVVDYRGSALSIEAGLGFGLGPGADHRVIKLILSRDLNKPAG